MEIVVGSIGLVLAMFLLAGLFLKGADLVQGWWHRVPPEVAQRRVAEFNARLASPQWSQLEQHFGAPAPDDLRRLYANPMVRSERLRIANPRPNEPDREEYIAWFLPADLRTIEEASWVVQAKEFPFADDGSNNYYTVAFGPDSTRPSVVRIHWHDGGDVEMVAERLDEFVGKAQPERT